MSDAMTSREIEDVLSSVRRLVSQESHRPAPSEPPARLILTEAHRVQPDAPAPVDKVAVAAPPAPPAEGVTGEAPQTPRKQLEETIAELEAAVSAMGEAWESETGDPGPTLERPATEAANVTAFARRAAPAEAKEPALPETPPPAAAAPETSEATEAATEAAPTAAPKAFVDTISEGAEAEGLEAVLDEEMLRQLVAYLVREELQGQLGERVTFQVRKLVRSEIAKVLDERGLI
jgi:cell pole-organizing protein PopZ